MEMLREYPRLQQNRIETVAAEVGLPLRVTKTVAVRTIQSTLRTGVILYEDTEPRCIHNLGHKNYRKETPGNSTGSLWEGACSERARPWT